MFTPASRQVAQERINDLLRQAEHHRLIKTALSARRERHRDQRRQRREARAAARALTARPAPADPQALPVEESP